jgi:hypothetical protein
MGIFCYSPKPNNKFVATVSFLFHHNIAAGLDLIVYIGDKIASGYKVRQDFNGVSVAAECTNLGATKYNLPEKSLRMTDLGSSKNCRIIFLSVHSELRMRPIRRVL